MRLNLSVGPRRQTTADSLLLKADMFWLADDWTSGGWVDRNNGTTATVVGTTVDTGGIFTVSTVDYTATRPLIHLSGTSANKITLPAEALPVWDKVRSSTIMIGWQTIGTAYTQALSSWAVPGNGPGIRFYSSAGVIAADMASSASMVTATTTNTASNVWRCSGVDMIGNTLRNWRNGVAATTVSTAALGALEPSAPIVIGGRPGSATVYQMQVRFVAVWLNYAVPDEYKSIISMNMIGA